MDARREAHTLVGCFLGQSSPRASHAVDQSLERVNFPSRVASFRLRRRRHGRGFGAPHVRGRHAGAAASNLSGRAGCDDWLTSRRGQSSTPRGRNSPAVDVRLASLLPLDELPLAMSPIAATVSASSRIVLWLPFALHGEI